MLKAVSEGETRFRLLVVASDSGQGFPSPDGPGRQFLAEFGEFPVYLVNRDMQASVLDAASDALAVTLARRAATPRIVTIIDSTARSSS